MAVSFEQYLDYLRTSTILQPRIQIQFLRKDESVESELIADVLGGTLTINRNNGVRRAISVELPNINGQFNPNRYGIWVNKKFKVFLGYKINGEDFLLPQGVFVMSDPQYNSNPSGSSFTLSGVDKFALLDGQNAGKLRNIYQIAPGINANDAIRDFLPIFNDNISPLLQNTTRTTPYTLRKNNGDAAGDVLNELAYMLARNIFYEEGGRLVYKDDIDDSLKAILYDFNFGDGVSFDYLGATHRAKFSKVRNVIQVIGDNVNGDIAIGLAINNDPLSPTNVNIIDEIVDVFNQDMLQLDQEALDLANFILKQTVSINNEVSINSIPMFHLDVDKIITLTDENLGFNVQRFLINNISIPLGIGGTMTTSVVKSDEPDIGEQF